MNISYRTRRFFRRFGLSVLWTLLIGLLIWACWLIWIQRHVVYTRDGVTIDFSRSSVDIAGEVAEPPAPLATIPIHYVENAPVEEDTSAELSQILGYVVTTDALIHDLSAVQQQVEALPAGTAVMMDVKSIYGNFYYNTDLVDARVSDSLDADQVDRLIQTMADRSLYAIARLPAFRDRNFGEENVSSGLAEAGGYLWSDEENCYWLDPADSGTMGYLIRIINELRGLGFDEVVFTDFCLPESNGAIVYEFEKAEDEVLREAADQLVSTCTTSNFAVSFQAGTDFNLPAGRSRLYVENIAADQASAIAGQVDVANPIINLVFLATSNDTRYNAYCALRTMNVGQQMEQEAPTGSDPGHESDPTGESESTPEETTAPAGE